MQTHYIRTHQASKQTINQKNGPFDCFASNHCMGARQLALLRAKLWLVCINCTQIIPHLHTT